MGYKLFQPESGCQLQVDSHLEMLTLYQCISIYHSHMEMYWWKEHIFCFLFCLLALLIEAGSQSICASNLPLLSVAKVLSHSSVLSQNKVQRWHQHVGSVSQPLTSALPPVNTSVYTDFLGPTNKRCSISNNLEYLNNLECAWLTLLGYSLGKPQEKAPPKPNQI